MLLHIASAVVRCSGWGSQKMCRLHRSIMSNDYEDRNDRILLTVPRSSVQGSHTSHSIVQSSPGSQAQHRMSSRTAGPAGYVTRVVKTLEQFALRRYIPVLTSEAMQSMV